MTRRCASRYTIVSRRVYVMWYSKRLVIAGLLAFWIGVSSPRPQHSLMEPRKGEFWTSGRQYGHWPETGFESSNGTFGQSGCGWLNFRVAREILWKSAAMANFGGGHRAKQSLHQPNLILPWSPPDSLERLLSGPDTRTWHGFANEGRRYCFVRYTMGAGSSTILKSAGTVNNERFGSARMMFVRRNVCSPIRGSLRLL